jgi:hypothetical protein
MRSKVRVGATVTLLVLVLASVTAASAISSGDDGSSHWGDRGSDDRDSIVLRFTAHEVASTYVDVGDTDYSQGDQFAFANDLLSNGTKVGEDGGVCTVTRVDTTTGTSAAYCTGSNSLPEGQVTVQGLINYGPEDEEFKQDPYSLAITGGTGRYRTARGEARFQELSPEEFRLELRIVR